MNVHITEEYFTGKAEYYVVQYSTTDIYAWVPSTHIYLCLQYEVCSLQYEV
jgi:hypothetical protein